MISYGGPFQSGAIPFPAEILAVDILIPLCCSEMANQYVPQQMEAGMMGCIYVKS